jgi:MFS family permease
MRPNRTRFLFLNVGHFLDHYFVLIFATVAGLHLTTEWNLSYAELVPYATPSFIAFGICSIPAGWLADKWSREGMMVIFFFGIGASSILAGVASTPLQLAAGLTSVGLFASIYHPVGLAMVIQGREQTGMPLAINGVFGNMGVASAALITGILIDAWSWRSAFIAPGIAAVLIGTLYFFFVRTSGHFHRSTSAGGGITADAKPPPVRRFVFMRIFGIILFTTAIGGLIFQSTTFALPKLFDERLSNFAGTATMVGWYAFVVFSLAALAQLVVGYLVDNHSVRTVFAGVVLPRVVGSETSETSILKVVSAAHSTPALR